MNFKFFMKKKNNPKTNSKNEIWFTRNKSTHFYFIYK